MGVTPGEAGGPAEAEAVWVTCTELPGRLQSMESQSLT